MNIKEFKFDYGWRKSDKFNFDNTDYNIDIVCEAFEDEEIIEAQSLAYNDFSQHKADYEDLASKIVYTFMVQNDFIGSSISPNTLLIKRNGDIGLLCDCSWDEENGIAIILKPNLEVVVQDDFL